MKFIAGVDREQALLLPERVEDYVGQDANVRFVDAFVDGLVLDQYGLSRSKPAATGRPGYAPSDMIKLYLWGYLNKVESSRRLERDCLRNLELIWLLRRLAPDFKTIADFRRDNAKAFKQVFRDFNLVCHELDLFGAQLVAIDGTKLKAVNAVERNHNPAKLTERLKRIDERLEEFLSRLEAADSCEAEAASQALTVQGLQQKLQALREARGRWQQKLERLKESGEAELSETDPESRAMRKVGVGYNGQIAVDSKHHLIAAVEVVADAQDYHQLSSLATQAKEELGVETLKVVADMGYYNHGELARCERAGVETYVPRPQKGSAEAAGLYGKKDFEYDEDSDCYRCPNGARLKAGCRFQKEGEPHVRYENPAACKRCPLKSKCTAGPHRTVTRHQEEAAADRMHERVRANPGIVVRRKALVEHVFGTMMFWMKQRTLLTRGLEKVRGEFALTALAYNIKRVLNLAGIDQLLASVALMRKKGGVQGGQAARKSGLQGILFPWLAKAERCAFLFEPTPVSSNFRA